MGTPVNPYSHEGRDPRAAGSTWTGGQYSLFRGALGAYLVVHFVALMPYAGELFARGGAVAEPGMSPLMGILPNPLSSFDSAPVVAALLLLGAVAGFGLAIGLADRVAALVCCAVLAWLFARNPLIANPSLPYVGLLLLAHSCLPRAPYGSFERRGQIDPGGEWRMPREIYLVVWILMALGYSYSGYTKLISPSWVDGTAFERVLNNPLARPGVMRRIVRRASSGQEHCDQGADLPHDFLRFALPACDRRGPAFARLAATLSMISSMPNLTFAGIRAAG